MTSPEGKEVLEKWLERTRGSQMAHYMAEELSSRRHLFVGLPAAIFSAVVGTTVFTALDSNEGLDIRLRVLVAIIAIVAAILTGCQTFLRFSEKADTHLGAATKFAALRRRIEQALSFPSTINAALVDEVRLAFDAITESAPNVSSRLWQRAMKQAGSEHFVPGFTQETASQS
ncbi:hypothetical protein ATY30_28390 [Sinorhizobium americanum]|nr:hypothetical protein CO664_24085 [Sinorhizobium sp. NG07B]POH24969.1 hypothetical protein ATY30_28390 [Sinorhizobium americanum]